MHTCIHVLLLLPVTYLVSYCMDGVYGGQYRVTCTSVKALDSTGISIQFCVVQ